MIETMVEGGGVGMKAWKAASIDDGAARNVNEKGTCSLLVLFLKHSTHGLTVLWFQRRYQINDSLREMFHIWPKLYVEART